MAIILPNGKQAYTTSDGTGKPLVGGMVWTYDAGTNNPRPTFLDADGTALNTNPVILDGRGEAVIFWDGVYKVTLTDSANAPIWTVDDIEAQDADAIADAVLDDFSDTTDSTKGDALVGVKQPFAATVGRTQHQKNAESISVTDFDGVDPTGATFSTAGLQAAIDAVFARGGGELRIPAGDYKTNDSLKHKDFVILRGEGSHCTRILCDNMNASVIEHTSPLTTGARRAAQGQSIIGLKLEHVIAATDLYNHPQCNGIGILDYGAYSITASGGVYDDVWIFHACDGISVGGEIFAYKIGVVTVFYCYKPFHKFGSGGCTSLTIDFFRMFACFHGFDWNNVTYSTVNFYLDNCGASVAGRDWGPANEVAIGFNAISCHLTVGTFGVELTPAVLFRIDGNAAVTVNSAGLIINPPDAFRVDPARIANLPAAKQAYLCSIENNSNFSFAGFTFDCQTSNGFPTGPTNPTNLFYHQVNSKIELENFYLYTDSYTLGPGPYTFYANNYSIVDAAIEVRSPVTCHGYHSTYGVIQLMQALPLWYGLPQVPVFSPSTDITSAQAGKSVVFYEQMTATISGTNWTAGDKVELYNTSGNATGITITPSGGFQLRWAGNTEVSAPRRLAANGLASIMILQPGIGILSGVGIT